MPAKAAVICLSYNHQDYVQEALESVIKQTYPSELIIVDDASTDNTVDKIKEFMEQHSELSFMTCFLEENVGNCRAFNKGLKLTEADYIIDLAADDRLLPKRVELGIRNMESNDSIAINFTNAFYINEVGDLLHSHYEVNEDNDSIEKVPEGDLFAEILGRYFICSPTMMYRASILKKLGGYDEALAFEDFDIMLRMSREFPLSYTDDILVEKRLLSNSMSKKQYKAGNDQLLSILKICHKAYLMIRSKKEKRALLIRIAFETKQAFINKRLLLSLSFIKLGFKTLLQK